MRVSIYLAGNIEKINHKIENSTWREGFKEKLRESLTGVDLKFLDPSVRRDDTKHTYSIFAQDVFFVANCSFVVVYGSKKQGIGTGIEMLTAKMHGVPVISVVPKNSYYRCPDKASMERLSEKDVENWVHPFMLNLSDVIVENLDQAAEWIKEHLNEKKKIKDHSVINKAIEYYKKNHYDKDEQAKEAFG